MPNPFFTLQQRIQSLIQANAYFAGLEADQILTEEVGDLDTEIEQKLLPLNFGVVVETADGKPSVSSYGALISMETLCISLVHRPTLDPAHSILDALAAAIAAVHGAGVQATPPPNAREFDFFAVVSHGRRRDAPPGVHVHELHVTAGLRLS
jgi:hypothetical protein